MDMNKQFGVREIANVVLKAKADMWIGATEFKAGAPVLYFDTLKTSTVEGAATTVYATGGRGNARLISWDGERTITFTMEDALISPMGLAVLSGAGLVKKESAPAHFTARIDDTHGLPKNHTPLTEEDGYKIYAALVEEDGTVTGELQLKNAVPVPKTGETYFVDYYANVETINIDIEPGKFSGNFYLEAATLFRDVDGKDHAAEFIIPNCRVQSNFTFSMASSGDPSTFTFTMDAFPGYTAYDKTKKVLCAIQMLEGNPADTQGEKAGE